MICGLLEDFLCWIGLHDWAYFLSGHCPPYKSTRKCMRCPARQVRYDSEFGAYWK